MKENQLLNDLENELRLLKQALELGHFETARRLVHDAEGLLAMAKEEDAATEILGNETTIQMR
jgi:hypothetical protein